jgi:hypothetical protein
MDTRLRWEVGTHFKRPTESQKSYMYFSFCYKKYLMYIKFVSNQPQIHIYKRLSILELTHYGFIIYRKDVSVVWKVLELFLALIIKPYETILVYS